MFAHQRADGTVETMAGDSHAGFGQYGGGDYPEVDWDLLAGIEAELENMSEAEFAYDEETGELVADVIDAYDDPEAYAVVVDSRRVAAEKACRAWRFFGAALAVAFASITFAFVLYVSQKE